MSDDTPHTDPSQVGPEPVGPEPVGPEPVSPAPGDAGTYRHRSRRRRERDPEPTATVAAAPPRDRSPDSGDARESDKVLRGLVGPGPSMLPLDAAMRARDASRPTAEDLAEAEETLVVVRRRYVPTESLPPGVKPAQR